MSRKTHIVVGIAWFRPQDWARLREISSDRENLDDTYAEWLGHANKAMRGIEEAGQPCERVLIDLDELLAWCQARGVPVNSSARADFVSEKVAL